MYSVEGAFLQTQLLCLLWWFCSENACLQLWIVICWLDSLMIPSYGFRESKLKEEDAWLNSFCPFWLGCKPVKLKIISSLESMRLDGRVSIPAERSTVSMHKVWFIRELKGTDSSPKHFNWVIYSTSCHSLLDLFSYAELLKKFFFQCSLVCSWPKTFKLLGVFYQSSFQVKSVQSAAIFATPPGSYFKFKSYLNE